MVEHLKTFQSFLLIYYLSSFNVNTYAVFKDTHWKIILAYKIGATYLKLLQRYGCSICFEQGRRKTKFLVSLGCKKWKNIL